MTWGPPAASAIIGLSLFEKPFSELILCLKQNHKSCEFFRSRLDEPMNLKKVEGTRNYRRKYRIMDVLKVEPRSQNEVMIAV